MKQAFTGIVQYRQTLRNIDHTGSLPLETLVDMFLWSLQSIEMALHGTSLWISAIHTTICGNWKRTFVEFLGPFEFKGYNRSRYKHLGIKMGHGVKRKRVSQHLRVCVDKRCDRFKLKISGFAISTQVIQDVFQVKKYRRIDNVIRITKLFWFIKLILQMRTSKQSGV